MRSLWQLVRFTLEQVANMPTMNLHLLGLKDFPSPPLNEKGIRGDRWRDDGGHLVARHLDACPVEAERSASSSACQVRVGNSKPDDRRIDSQFWD